MIALNRVGRWVQKYLRVPHPATVHRISGAVVCAFSVVVKCPPDRIPEAGSCLFAALCDLAISVGSESNQQKTHKQSISSAGQILRKMPKREGKTTDLASALMPKVLPTRSRRPVQFHIFIKCALFRMQNPQHSFSTGSSAVMFWHCASGSSNGFPRLRTKWG